MTVDVYALSVLRAPRVPRGSALRNPCQMASAFTHGFRKAEPRGTRKGVVAGRAGAGQFSGSKRLSPVLRNEPKLRRNGQDRWAEDREGASKVEPLAHFNSHRP